MERFVSMFLADICLETQTEGFIVCLASHNSDLTMPYVKCFKNLTVLEISYQILSLVSACSIIIHLVYRILQTVKKKINF